MKKRTFEDLDCWKKSRILVNKIYFIARNSDLKRDYGLRDQITRAAISVMSNIAEGFERSSNKEFIYFLNVSKASCSEVRSQLYILKDIGYINDEEFNKLYTLSRDISKMTHGLMTYLRSKE